MQTFKKFRNPIFWLVGFLVKKIIRFTFFKNVENQDFNKLVDYTLSLLPNEKLIDIVILLYNIFKSKPSDLQGFKTINEALIHTLPIGNRTEIIAKEDRKAKYLFIFLILWEIKKRIFFLIKNIILLPFKIGVYSFIAFLFGIRMDCILSFFDIFRFNLPSWTYNKLLELHISWMSWFKHTLNIKSITTELENNPQLPKPRMLSDNLGIGVKPDTEIKPDTFLYLTKKQWLYLSISILTALGAYYGFTGGIPFTKTFETNSDSQNDDKGEGSSKGPIHSFKAKPRREDLLEQDKTWQDTFSEYGHKVSDKVGGLFSWIKNKVSGQPADVDWDRIDKKERDLIEQLKRDDKKRWLELLEREKNKGLIINKDGILSKEIIDNKEEVLIKVSSKKSSPTHPDPEREAERTNLFRYPQDKVKDSSLDSSNMTDSTETIKPATKDYRPSPITPSTEASEGPTYPPVHFSKLADHPFASGGYETIDPSLDPTIKKGIVRKGTNILSARFLDNSSKNSNND